MVILRNSKKFWILSTIVFIVFEVTIGGDQRQINSDAVLKWASISPSNSDELFVKNLFSHDVLTTEVTRKTNEGIQTIQNETTKLFGQDPVKMNLENWTRYNNYSILSKPSEEYLTRIVEPIEQVKKNVDSFLQDSMTLQFFDIFKMNAGILIFSILTIQIILCLAVLHLCCYVRRKETVHTNTRIVEMLTKQTDPFKTII